MTNDPITSITYGYMVRILKQNLLICNQLLKVKWPLNIGVTSHRLNFILPHIKLNDKSTCNTIIFEPLSNQKNISALGQNDHYRQVVI